MNEFDTTTYELRRNQDNTITRIEGRAETQEPDHLYNIAYCTQVVANSQAQQDKLGAFEATNPPFEILEELQDESEPV